MDENGVMVTEDDLIAEWEKLLKLYSVHIGIEQNGEVHGMSVFFERDKSANTLLKEYGEEYLAYEMELANEITTAVSEFYARLKMMGGENE